MEFKFLFMIYLFYQANCLRRTGWFESDEESYFRQIDILSIDQGAQVDNCSIKFDFDNNNASISKNLFIFDKDYFPSLNLQNDILIYFRRYNTPVTQLYKYKNKFFLRDVQCAFKNEKLKNNGDDIFLQDSGSGFSKIKHKQINQSNYISDVFIEQDYVNEIFRTFSCLGYQDEQFNIELQYNDNFEEVFKNNGKYYYAKHANFYDQDYLKVSLAIEYQKIFVAHRYQILSKSTVPCVHSFQNKQIFQEQQDAVTKSSTQFPVIPLKTYVLIQLDIDEQTFQDKKLEGLLSYFTLLNQTNNTSQIIKIFNQLYFKQCQAALYMGLNISCGLYRRCLINKENQQIYHFHAQQIEGDPREVVKFIYSPYIKVFLQQNSQFGSESQDNFIGPMLPGMKKNSIDISKVDLILDLVDEFLANYFIFGGYILKSFQKIDMLLQDENWIQFNKMFYKVLYFVIKAGEDNDYYDYALKQIELFQEYLNLQIDIMNKILQVRKYNKQQLQKKQNEELEQTIVDIYKKILKILELNQNLKKLNDIDQKLSNNLNFLIQKEIQLNPDKIDHQAIQEYFKKYLELNLQSNLQKSLSDILENLSFAIDDRKKKNILQNKIGVVQNIDKFFDERIKKNQQQNVKDKKKNKTKQTQEFILEQRRNKKELNLFLYKKGLIDDLPEHYKQSAYQNINSRIKENNKDENKSILNNSLLYIIIMLMIYQLIYLILKQQNFANSLVLQFQTQYYYQLFPQTKKLSNKISTLHQLQLSFINIDDSNNLFVHLK